MGIDFHAVTIPQAVFRKYHRSPTMQHLWLLHSFVFDGGDDEGLLLKLAEDFCDDYFDGDPKSSAQTLAELKALIKAREFPARTFNLGSEWRTLQETLEDLTEQLPALAKCFGTAEEIGDPDRELDVLYGRDLTNMVAALKKVRLAPLADDEGDFADHFIGLLNELREFYEEAVAKNEVVMRGYY